MNKPAQKEPSMDEILSSIRQIIADDDAALAPRKPVTPAAAAPVMQPAPTPRPIPVPPPMVRREPIQPPPEPEPEPLTLTSAQMLRDEPAEAPAAPFSFADVLETSADLADHSTTVESHLIDPDDVAFESDDEPAYTLEAPAYGVEIEEPEPVVAPAPVMAQPARPVPIPPAASRAAMPPPPAPPRVAPSVSRAAPMPDPTLSSELAERLLEPATDAAVKQNFAKLNGLSMMGSGMTLDALMRDMLRPMLKDWLDENLPSLVERMVEKEISRISRGE